MLPGQLTLSQQEKPLPRSRLFFAFPFDYPVGRGWRDARRIEWGIEVFGTTRVRGWQSGDYG